MTINEAKICLSIQVEVKHRLGKDYEAKALQLGVEALKAWEEHRGSGSLMDPLLLPSETLAK